MEVFAPVVALGVPLEVPDTRLARGAIVYPAMKFVPFCTCAKVLGNLKRVSVGQQFVTLPPAEQHQLLSLQR